MIEGTTRLAAMAAALGAATSGGVFFGFSTFIMPALQRLEPRNGLTAMQAINRAAPNPLFGAALFGTAALCGGLVVVGARNLDEPWSGYVLAGGVLYLAGIGLTLVYHAPRNNTLALVDPTSPEAARAWLRYASAWTTWNHVRTATSLAAAATFVLGLRAR